MKKNVKGLKVVMIRSHKQTSYHLVWRDAHTFTGALILTKDVDLVKKKMNVDANAQNNT